MTAKFSQLDTKYAVRFQKAFVLERPVKMSPALGVCKRLRNLCAVALLSAAVFTPTALLAQSSSISLVSSSPISVYGVPVTFTATVPLGATGTVTFTNNGTTIGVVPISGTTATLTTSSSLLLGAGNDVIGASWSGDPNNPVSLNQTVYRATPSIVWNPVGSATISSMVNKITTVAGNLYNGNIGDGGAAVNANLASPSGIALDGQGNVYIADYGNNRIRKLTISTGVITTVAGTGVAGYSADGGLATSTALDYPRGVAVDAAGNLYIADTNSFRLRKVNASTGIITTVAYTTDYLQYLAVDGQGNVYFSGSYRIQKVIVSTGTTVTVAGTGASGFSGDGGPAINAQLSLGGMTIDSAGNLYIADMYNHRVRRIDASTGIITTIAGNGLSGYYGDGDLATNTALNGPYAVAFDSSGNLYIADKYNYRIRMVDASTGIISTFAGNGMGVGGHTGDGGFAAGAELQSPTGVTVDSLNNVYVSEESSPGTVRKIASSNQTIASIPYGTPLSSAQLNASANAPGTFTYIQQVGNVLPRGMQTLKVYFSPTDWNNYVPVTLGVPLGVTQQVPSSLNISTSNPTVSHGDWLTLTATISSGATGTVTFYDGSTVIGSAQINGTTATLTLNSLAVGLHTITATWPGDLLFFSATSNAITETVNPPISLVSSNPISIYSVPVTFTATVRSGATGTVTFTNNGTTIGVVPISGATAILTTSLSLPLGAGNNVIGAIWSGDPNNPAYINQTINKATPTIVWNPGGSTTINSSVYRITNVAGNPNSGNLGDGGAAINANLYPFGVAVDGQGNIFIADTGNQRIRKVAISTGVITTVAGTGVAGYSGDGGPATSAALSNPRGVAVDASDNVYIADTNNYRIRKVDGTTGIITTIAGTGTDGQNSVDGSVATNSTIGYVAYLALDAQRNIYLADNYRVRKITASSGIITTVAGNAMAGFSGDGGLASNAKISANGIAFDSTGNLYFVDATNGRVRRVDISTGIITTIAGNGLSGYYGDGDLATNTAIGPTAIAFDSSDNLYIADYNNFRIRRVDASSGVITTLAGNGGWGHSGDDGFAAGALIMNPTNVATDSTGNVYFAENYSPGSIRKVASSNQSIAAISYGTPLGAAQLNASTDVPGRFFYTPPIGTVLPVGQQTLMVNFGPYDYWNYNSVTFGVPLDVVIQVASSLSVSSSNPTVNHGDSLTFTATITSGATGSVTFYDGSTVIGSAPINGSTATLTISLLAAGSHTITATWPGDFNFTSATSNAITQVISNNVTPPSDTGTITLTVNGTVVATTRYGANSTLATIASGIAASASGNSLVNVTANGGTLQIMALVNGPSSNYSYMLVTTSWDSANFSHPSFLSTPITGTLAGGANAGSSSSGTIYSYNIPSYDSVSQLTGYDAVGNIVGYMDSVTGSWLFGYDSLNRLTSGTGALPGVPSQYYCWSYDSFGNRTAQNVSNQAFQGSDCQPSLSTNTATYDGNNRITYTNASGIPIQPTYDEAGNVGSDGNNTYLYDAEGRICAVKTTPISGGVVMIQYLYNAAGQRVAKGTITSWNCDPTSNGFTPTNNYLLGPSGEQLTELDGSGRWLHTNVYAAGNLFATYDGAGLHFRVTDWLGTLRVQANYAGALEQRCASLPFGDAQTCVGATEHFFTGKEHDNESGNDYFGARYYASTMGRWLSPDWSAKAEPVPYANLKDPQSLNLYAYAGNNPLAREDSDGHFWEELGNKLKWGVWVNNEGLNVALQAQADQDRAILSKMHGFTINGKSPAEAAKGSNQNVILAERAAMEYVSNAAMSSKQMIGGLLIMGVIDPAAGAEEAAASGARALGLGITGTKAATTVAERLAIEAAEADPSAGKVLQTTLKDARWPTSQGWVKMESRSPGGVVVHWVRNIITGEAADFKLK